MTGNVVSHRLPYVTTSARQITVINSKLGVEKTHSAIVLSHHDPKVSIPIV
ncbi:MAG: hypothetical protein ACI9KE_006405 [Polyangiales bacterium]|jgi:hypothetical protein